MVFFSVLIAALATAQLFPQTPIGKLFRRMLIEAPAHGMTRLTPAKIIAWIVLCIALVAIAQAFPPDLALFAAGDVAAYTEVLTAAFLVAANVNARRLINSTRLAMKSALRWMSARFRPPRQQGRVRAVSRTRARLRPPSADDDGGAVPAFA